MEIGVTTLQQAPEDGAVLLVDAPSAGGGTLAEQLFANRILSFLYNERERLSRSGNRISPPELCDHLERLFLDAWQQTGQPYPTELAIGVNPSAPPEAIGISIRVTPPSTVCPNPKPLALTLSF